MKPSRRSFLSLNAVNFFLAQIADVVMPFLNVFLHQNQWRYDQIGVAMAVTSFGSLIFQVPAGVICDKIKAHRLLLAATAILLGTCYVLLPILVNHIFLIMFVLFISGTIGTFFSPLLGSMALRLAGPENLNILIGKNRLWNHAGNFAAALIALAVVRAKGFVPLFYIAATVSLLAAISSLFIRPADMHWSVDGRSFGPSRSSLHYLWQLLRDSEVRDWLFCIALFHAANGPLTPLVSLYMQHVGSSQAQIAWIVLVAQPVMIPFAWLAGKYCGVVGRKPILALAFVLLPVRIFLYTLTRDPSVILAITALDGIIAAIYGVLVFVVSSDLTEGKRGFNSLIGLTSITPSLGAMAGAALQGFLTEAYGFQITFYVFTGIAVFAAVLFLIRVKESQRE